MTTEIKNVLKNEKNIWKTDNGRKPWVIDDAIVFLSSMDGITPKIRVSDDIKSNRTIIQVVDGHALLLTDCNGRGIINRWIIDSANTSVVICSEAFYPSINSGVMITRKK